jgi:hypothetical protein
LRLIDVVEILKVNNNKRKNNMKIAFDLAKSLNECPPTFSKTKGVKHINRLILNRDKVEFGKTSQTYRVDVNLDDNISNLKQSYSANGFIYTQKPQVVRKSDKNPKFYTGVSGHNRDEAQESLEWETAIYDIVEFDTPLDELKFAYEDNQHPPAAGTKPKDILKGLTKASGKMVNLKDDKTLTKLIAILAADKSLSKQKTIFDNFREDNSKYDSIKPYGGESANIKAMELEAPVKGDKNYDDVLIDGKVKYKGVNRYGYVKEPGGYKTLLFDGLRLWHNEGCSDDINVTGYVKDPTPTNLFEKRSLWMKEFKKMEDFTYDMCSNMTGMSVADIKSKGKFPFKFNGFLPQNLSPDITNGGNPVETDIVDIKGKSIK